MAFHAGNAFCAASMARRTSVLSAPLSLARTWRLSAGFVETISRVEEPSTHFPAIYCFKMETSGVDFVAVGVIAGLYQFLVGRHPSFADENGHF